jgi:hypothetical protein
LDEDAAAPRHAVRILVGLPIFGDCPVRQDPSANPQTSEQKPGQNKPLSRLYREVGLAAVAAELNVHVDTLEPEVAKAVETGAAALFLAGYGPRLTHYPPSDQASEEGSRRKATRAASKARRSPHIRTRKSAVAKAAS